MSRDFIVVAIEDDSNFNRFNCELYYNIDDAFKEVNSFKQFHKENDSLYEIRMSFYDNEKDALEYINELKVSV
jgi:hypothetical protein